MDITNREPLDRVNGFEASKVSAGVSSSVSGAFYVNAERMNVRGNSSAQRLSPIRRIRSWKRGSERRRSKAGDLRANASKRSV
jgi:hypothetical protein